MTAEERGGNMTALREQVSEHPPPQVRANVWKDPRYKWPNARIPYVISSQYNRNDRALIAAAIREWESKTCIRFVPATRNDRDYVELTPNDGKSTYCNSYIGRQGGRQFLVMFSSSCMWLGGYIHELGHLIGFGHEHQRPDRDYYIKINWENIESSK